MICIHSGTIWGRIPCINLNPDNVKLLLRQLVIVAGPGKQSALLSSFCCFISAENSEAVETVVYFPASTCLRLASDRQFMELVPGTRHLLEVITQVKQQAQAA